LVERFSAVIVMPSAAGSHCLVRASNSSTVTFQPPAKFHVSGLIQRGSESSILESISLFAARSQGWSPEMRAAYCYRPQTHMLKPILNLLPRSVQPRLCSQAECGKRAVGCVGTTEPGQLSKNTTPINAWCRRKRGQCISVCWDWYWAYSTSPPTDPRGPSGVLSYRVLRGGGWNDYAINARCASPQLRPPGHRQQLRWLSVREGALVSALTEVWLSWASGQAPYQVQQPSHLEITNSWQDEPVPSRGRTCAGLAAAPAGRRIWTPRVAASPRAC